MIQVKQVSSDERNQILDFDESYFIDLKGKNITPDKLSSTISAFANSGGGEIYIGIEEAIRTDGKNRRWDGFNDQEAANNFFHLLHELDPLSNNFTAQFLKAPDERGLVLHLIISKTREIIKSKSGKVFVRVNASNRPVEDEALERLRYDKGIDSFEDSLLPVGLDQVTNSLAIIKFLIDAIPTAEPLDWLKKQFMLMNGKATVASVLLYSDSPQAVLPKRSAIKILRYKTKSEAERDFLTAVPETVEGPLYDLIYSGVTRITSIIESIEKLGAGGMEQISYPKEALHELLTNAILHRDYSVPADVQVRIFDNRVEIESPGRLPGHVTISNIATTQFARNPKIVRLINKFKNPPNKDVGEGINTAFEAMKKLRLKKPEFHETDSALIVTLRHESLASPEQIVMHYLNDHEEITNQIARDITGIKSENTMKNVFYRLRDNGNLEQVPRVKGKKHSWRKPVGAN
jgi:ATP-dependent DNA helicase RecG